MEKHNLIFEILPHCEAATEMGKYRDGNEYVKEIESHFTLSLFNVELFRCDWRDDLTDTEVVEEIEAKYSLEALAEISELTGRFQRADGITINPVSKHLEIRKIVKRLKEISNGI